MKNAFFRSLSLTILALVLCCTSAVANEEYLSKYTLVSENEYLQLYVNEETTEIAVLDKSTNYVWFSSPPDLSMERIKRGSAREGMRALLSLSYYTPDRSARTLNSYVDSVLNEEFTITPVDGGIRIDYLLGKRWPDDAYVPAMIRKEKFEAVLEKVEDKFDREILEEDYTLLTLVETAGDPYERVNVYGIDPQRVFGNWDLIPLSGPVLTRSYGLRDTPEERKKYLLERLSDTIILYRNDIDMRNLITAEDVEHMKNAEVYVLLDGTYPRFDKDEIPRIFREAGYTPEDVIEDHIAARLDPPIPNPEVFTIPIIVTIDGPNLVVTIPAGEIEYPIDVVTKDGEIATFMPQSLDLLPYFGAADTAAEGYIFVPDRSGALIRLNNQNKLTLPSFLGSVYGVDRSIAPQQERIARGSLIRLPVYGLKNGDRAFFSIIEDGQALAYIRAELAGKTDSFNKVSCGFTLTPRTTITLWGVREEGEITSRDDRLVDVYQTRPYQGDITVRIAFLSGDEAGYSGMANLYRSYLIDRYGLSRVASDSTVPLYLELIGGIHKQEVVRGAPREVIDPLTSYAQAQEIISDLLESGVENIKVRYVGWTKGGVHHYFADKLELEKALGTRDELDQLIGFAKEHGVEIYPDIDLLTVYRNTLFDGFRLGRDAARYLNKDAVHVYDYNIATFQRIPEQRYAAVSPRRLERLVSQFLKGFSNYGFGGVSLRSMGRVVYSDFREGLQELVDRQQAAQMIQAAMDSLRSEGLLLMVSGGNDIAFPYAKHIVGAPTEGSNMHFFDESVPFYQMALHGYINYAGEPLNPNSQYRQALLKCLETGSVPYYRWTYADSAAVKDTLFNYLLSTNYTGWLDEAVALYKEVSSVLNEVCDQAIVDHRKLDEGIYRTTYENGLTVVVNYTTEDYSFDGVTVEAESYIVLEKERGQ